MLRELQGDGLRVANPRFEPGTPSFEVEHVPVSLMRFQYPVLLPPDSGPGVPVASLEDIAAMKIEAISSRGARKDFVDLYAICQNGLGLREALDCFSRRFASAHLDVFHRIKSPTFFEDAEREPELVMLEPVDWSDVRDFFEREARNLWASGTTL